MIKIWSNTKTLDGLVDDLIFTESKSEANIALLGSKSINLNEFPNLKGIFRAGVSKDNIPIEQAKQKGIKVAFPSPKTIEYIYEETANFTCYLIFRMLYISVGTISPWVKFSRDALQDKILLIIGKGNIGKRVEKKMNNFMIVKSYDVFQNTGDELEELLKSADCVSIHIPSSPENKDFIDQKKLSLMKDNAVLVNTARGAIVSEDALYNELKKQRLFAAFDVYWQEPYNGKMKSLSRDRFFMTPHVASTCNAFLKGSADDLRKLVKEIENA